MKKASGSIRIDLAQFREMEVFTQFSSDLDESTKQQLQHGHVLMELLKQPLYHPLSLADEVITLVVANTRMLSDIETKRVKEFQKGMLSFFQTEHTQVIDEIMNTKTLSDELKENIINIANEYKSRWV